MLYITIISIFAIVALTIWLGISASLKLLRKGLKARWLLLIGLGIFIVSVLAIPGGNMAADLTRIAIWLVVLVSWIVSVVYAIKHRGSKDKKNRTIASESTGDVVTDYAKALLVTSAAVADKLQREQRLTDSQSTSVMIEVMGFCIIMLMYRFTASHIPKPKGTEVVDDILKGVAKLQSDSKDQEQQAYVGLGQEIGVLVHKYGSMPLGTDNDKAGLGGTLMWEYGKLMTETAGKEVDLAFSMLCVKFLTMANDNLQNETDRLMEYLR